MSYESRCMDKNSSYGDFECQRSNTHVIGVQNRSNRVSMETVVLCNMVKIAEKIYFDTTTNSIIDIILIGVPHRRKVY